MVNLFVLDAYELLNPYLFEQCFNLLESDRKENILQCKSTTRKIQLVGSGLMIRYILTEYGIGLDSIKISSSGKPVVKSNKNFHFNLSHSENILICAVADKPVGVDVEKLKSRNFSLTARCFSKQESDFLFSLPKNLQKINFYKIWTLKESYIKALGLGMKLPLKSFSVVPYKKSLNDFYFKEYNIDGFAVSACCLSKDFSEDITFLTINQISKKQMD